MTSNPTPTEREQLACLFDPGAFSGVGDYTYAAREPRRVKAFAKADEALAIRFPGLPAISAPIGGEPVEVTVDMQNAGWREVARQGLDIEAISVAPVFLAMLAAAPHPPAVPVVGAEDGQTVSRSQPCADASALAPFTAPPGWALVPLKPSRKLINDLAHEWAYSTEEACESYCGFLDVVARHGFGGSDPEAYDEDAAKVEGEGSRDALKSAPVGAVTVSEELQALRDFRAFAMRHCDPCRHGTLSQKELAGLIYHYPMEEAALTAALPLGDQGALVEWFSPTHRHVKSGGLYQVIADGYDAANHHGEEAPRVVIYRNDAGVWWTRPADEFHDDRFEPLAPSDGAAS